MSQLKTCCYVLRPASIGVGAVYCGKPSTYKMVREDDGLRYRKYTGFCEEHQQIRSKTVDDEEI